MSKNNGLETSSQEQQDRQINTTTPLTCLVDRGGKSVLVSTSFSLYWYFIEAVS